MELEITLNPKLDKKAIVFSHERSGTHFLMNTLALNFGYSVRPWINLDFDIGLNFYDTASMDAFFRNFDDIPAANIFKSHHSFDFVEPWLPALKDTFEVFYIYRNPLDTLYSYWQYSQNVPWHEGPAAPHLEAFLKAAPQGAMLRYQTKQFPHILKRWEHHVTHWLNAASVHNITTIPYESLNTHFKKTVMEVAKKLGRKPQKVARPSKNFNVVQPSTNNREGFYSEQTRAFIQETVGETLKKFQMVMPA